MSDSTATQDELAARLQATCGDAWNRVRNSLGMTSGISEPQEVSEKVKPFDFHGVSLTRKGTEWVGDCVFCNKSKHFYVSDRTGQFECKRCGESGNIVSFLDKYHQLRLRTTKKSDYQLLAKQRGIPADVFKQHDFACDAERWLIPVRNEKGKLANLKVWISGSVLVTPTRKQHLYLANDIQPTGPIYVCEGEWDALALKHLLEVNSAAGSVVGVPGASTFKAEWRSLFDHREVILLYDNDAPGRSGRDKTIKLLAGHASAIKIIDWPEGVSEGGDIRDFLIEHQSDLHQGWNELQQRFIAPALPEETKSNSDGLQAVRFESVIPQTVEWLWQDRIPLGKLTIVSGDPGLGKTFLVLDIMARLSRGLPYPDGAVSDLSESAFISAEDGATDTIRPRLDLLGANPKFIWNITHVENGNGGEFLSLDRHTEYLDHWLTNHPDVRLLALDPLPAFLGKIDSHNNSEVRGILGRLATLAEKHRVGIIGINHLTKGGERSIYRQLGSIAFTAAARAVWQVCSDPDDSTRRLLLPVKMNLAKSSGLAFHVSDSGIRWESDAIEMSPDELLRSDDSETPRQEAKAWILAKLNDGPISASEIEQLARKDGISERTLKRAKKELGIESQQTKAGWTWLPPQRQKANSPTVER